MNRPDAQSLYTPPPWAPDQSLEWLESCWAVQSMQFMIDCLPMIRKLLMRPGRQTATVLDVGTGTGAGANVLATLYQGRFLGGLQLKVDAIELMPNLKRYAEVKFPLVNYIVGDIHDYRNNKQQWDLVICSHLIEHIEQPEEFIAVLAGLAREWVLLYAPWKERDPIEGHVNRIDLRFLRRAGAKLHMIIDSPAWYRLEQQRVRCVAFAVPGRARRDE